MKPKHLAMMLLLSCSTSYCIAQSKLDSISSTGGRSDSVLISYDDMRAVNVKLIELDCALKVNEELHRIVENDIKIKESLMSDIYVNHKKTKKYKRQRNLLIGISSFLTGGLIISLCK